ncbi:MAG: efflux RND transporter periplasmic adaptor subunit [Pseudomonadota bacterium]
MRLGSIALAAAVIAGLSWWFLLRHGDGVPVAMAPATTDSATPSAGAGRGTGPVRVMTMLSRAEPTTAEMRLRGRTKPNREVVVRAETDGLIASAPLRAGALVEDGDILCRLAVGAREAELRKAEAAVEQARIQSEAANRLSAQGFAAETTRAERQALFEDAKASLDAMMLDIQRLEIRAPFSGRLETDTAELGALLNRGDDCATLVDLSVVKVIAFASERQVDKLSPGQAAEVRLAGGTVLPGTIGFVAATADEATRTFQVEAELKNADGRLRGGMTAEIRVETSTGRAHRLPQSALTLDAQGRLGVRLVEDGKALFAPVDVVNDTEDAAFVSGLPETARVIVVGQEFVRDGRPVIAVPFESVLDGAVGAEPALTADPAAIAPPAIEPAAGQEARG